MDVRAASTTLWLMLCIGCSAAPLELSVDVRTDLLPGVDFTVAQVELTPDDGPPVTRDARIGDPFWRGVRVADFTNVARGPSHVRATLLDASGEEVVSRKVALELESSYALTLVLTRDCVPNPCPGPSGLPSETECLAGRCVEPRCGGPSGGSCGDLDCSTHAECASFDCAAICIAGACVCVGSAPDGAVSVPDGGDCAGECTPGDTEEESRACGDCDMGIERRTRTCGADCRWGDFGDFGECEISVDCSPGDTESRTVDCGNCGNKRQTRSCGTSCTWSLWTDDGACSNQGVCEPGTTRGGCDINYAGNPTECGIQRCTDACRWGSCQLADGAQCLANRGNTFRCCTPPGGGAGWQYCNGSCRWNACESHSC